MQIAGGVIVALASIVINRTKNYSDLLQDGILTLPVIILIIGLVVGLIGFFGCFGAMRENKCMLYTVSVKCLNYNDLVYVHIWLFGGNRARVFAVTWYY